MDETLPLSNESLMPPFELTSVGSPTLNDTALTTTSGVTEQMDAYGTATQSQVLTLKEQEQRFAELRKENFELKLRLYYLSTELERRGGSPESIDDRDIKLNVELQVTVSTLREELRKKQTLLLHAKSALDRLVENQQVEVAKVEQVASEEVAKLKAKVQEEEELNEELRQEKDSCFGRLVDLERKCKDYIDMLHGQEEEMARLKSKEAECLKEMGRLERELGNKDHLSRETSSRTKELEATLNSLHSAADEIPLLRSQLKAKDQEVKAMVEEMRNRDIDFKRLQAEMERLKLTHLHVTEEMKQLQKSTLDRTQKHYQDLLEQRNKQLAEMRDEIIELKKAAKQTDEKAKQKREEAKAKVDSLQNSLAGKESQIARLQSECSRKETALQKLSSNNSKSTEALEDLTESLQEKDREIERLQGLVQERDHRLEESHREVDEMDQRARAAERQAQAVERLKNQVAEFEGNAHSMQGNYVQMQQKLHRKELELENFTEKRDFDVSRMRDALEGKDQTIALLKEQIEHGKEMAARKAQLLEEQYKTKNETLASRDDLMGELQQQLKEKAVEIKELEDAISAKSIALAEVEDQAAEDIGQRDKHIADLRRSLEAAKLQASEQQAKLHSERDGFKFANRQLQAELDAKVKDIEFMTQQNASRSHHVEALESEQQHLKDRSQDDLRRVSLERKERKRLEDYVEALKMQAERVKRELAEVSRQLKQNLLLNETLQGQLKESEKKVKQLSPGRSREMNLISDLQRQLDSSRREMDSLRSQMDDTQRANDSIRATMADAAVADNDKVKAALSESQRMAESLRGGLQKLQQQSVANEFNSRKEIDRLRSQLAEAKELNDRLQDRVEEVSVAAKAAGIHPESGSPLRGSWLEQEIERLQRRLAEAERRNRAWETEVGGLKKRMETERREDEGRKMKEMGALKGKLSEAQKRIEALSRQLKEKKESSKRPADLRKQFREAMKCALELRERLKAEMAKKREDSSLGVLDLSQFSLFDGEAAFAQETARQLHSQLEKSSMLNASLQNELNKFETTLRKSESGDGRRPLSPSIVIADVNDGLEETADVGDLAAGNIVTSTPRGGLENAIRNFQSHLEDSQSIVESLRSQLDQFVAPTTSGRTKEGGDVAVLRRQLERAEARLQRAEAEVERLRREKKEVEESGKGPSAFATAEVVDGLKRQMEEGLIAAEGLDAQIRQEENDKELLLENVDLLRSRLAEGQQLVERITATKSSKNGRTASLQLEEFIKKLKTTDDMKFEATKAIYDQLSQTHSLLKKTKRNLTRLT
eukprot:m.310966 g.310966  ORF g.310966 m.310966 type:complete len:1289 (+) comp57124_c0_seq1:61-3927(+)